MSLPLPHGHDPVIVHCVVYQHRRLLDGAAVVVHPADELLVMMTFHQTSDAPIIGNPRVVTVATACTAYGGTTALSFVMWVTLSTPSYNP